MLALRFIPVFYDLLRGLILNIYLYCVKLTSKVIVLDSFNYEKRIKKGDCFILGYWHNESLLQVFYPRPLSANNIYVYVSEELTADSISSFIINKGLKVIRPTNKEDIINKFLYASELLSSKRTILFIAVDGPYGPNQSVKPGIFYLSKMSGTPIIPVHCVAKKNFILNTWDKRKLPKLFNQIHITSGPSFQVDKNANKMDIHKASQRLKAELESLCNTDIIY